MASGGNDKHLASFPHRDNCSSYKQRLLERRKCLKQTGQDQKSTKIVHKLPDTVLNGFEVLWRQLLLCDVSIVTSTKIFKAHKLVLVSCSDFFYDLFVERRDTVIEEVSLYEINSSILEAILECMYTGKIHVTETNVEEILKDASNLGFFLIQDACEEFLIENIDLRNCLHMLDIAFKFGLSKLTDKALEIAASNFKTVCKRPRFNDLPVEQVLALFKRDDLDTEDEIEVFNVMIEWIGHRKQFRLQHAPNLLATIRLPLLSPATIADTVESVAFLMDIPECQSLVQEAFHYHCMPARQSILQSLRTQPRKKIKILSLVAVGGGPRYKTEEIMKDIKRYNAVTKSWETMTSLPEPKHHHAVAVLGGFLYVAGGETSMEKRSFSNKVFRYNPRNNTWSQMANMVNQRQSFQMVTLNGHLYIIGGRVDDMNATASVEKYNPMSNKWEEIAPLSCQRKCVAAAALNGKIFAVGGSGKKTVSGTVECYSPTMNKWHPRKSILHPRFFAQLIPVRGSLYLVGGANLDSEGNIKCVEEVERYLPGIDSWIEVCRMKTPRAEFGCAILESKIYVVGGYNWNSGERLISVEFMDTDTHIWTELESFQVPLTGICCCTLCFFVNDNESVKKKKEQLKS